MKRHQTPSSTFRPKEEELHEQAQQSERKPHAPEAAQAEMNVEEHGDRRHQEEMIHAQSTSPQRRTEPLSTGEILNKTLSFAPVKAFRREIEYYSTIVFGTPRALLGAMDKILRNPDTGAQILQGLSAHPNSFHKLAGYSVFGFKTGVRRQAEENRDPLCRALEGYMDAVKEAKAQVMHTHGVEQERLGVQRDIEKSLQETQGRQQAVPEQERQAHRHTLQRGASMTL